MKKETVGVIGLGLIGTSLAKRLLAAGFEVHGYDVNPERGTVLASVGGTAEASLADLGERCRTILIAVLSTDPWADKGSAPTRRTWTSIAIM